MTLSIFEGSLYNFLYYQGKRLIGFLTQAETLSDIIKGICYRIMKKNYATAGFGIVQLEKRKSPQEIIKILNNYQSNEEFRKAYPDSK